MLIYHELYLRGEIHKSCRSSCCISYIGSIWLGLVKLQSLITSRWAKTSLIIVVLVVSISLSFWPNSVFLFAMNPFLAISCRYHKLLELMDSQCVVSNQQREHVLKLFVSSGQVSFVFVLLLVVLIKQHLRKEDEIGEIIVLQYVQNLTVGPM